MLTREPPEAGQEIARRELAADDAIAELARDLLAHRLRVAGGQVQKQDLRLTVHIRYIRKITPEVLRLGPSRAPALSAASGLRAKPA